MTTIAIVGTVGVPARYGGFETLAENLVRYRCQHHIGAHLLVYCSGRRSVSGLVEYLGAELRYIPLPGNGIGSVVYDSVSLFDAVWRKSDVILLLGVSGALALPLVRLVSRGRIVTNIDGIEWRRAKWRGLARWFLHFSEWLAVRFSHVVIADNEAIARHARDRYKVDCVVIPYGGDHALVQGNGKECENCLPLLPSRYGLSLCRIEPENNIEMILEAFASNSEQSLVFVGNWASSQYGRDLKDRFTNCANLTLLDPIYDAGALYLLRSGASFYVHGHSAGGTNPSLVEIMHFGCPVFAYDCVFNRSTTENKALFFRNSDELCLEMRSSGAQRLDSVGQAMREVARRRYTWDSVGASYFNLFGENPRA